MIQFSNKMRIRIRLVYCGIVAAFGGIPLRREKFNEN